MQSLHAALAAGFGGKSQVPPSAQRWKATVHPSLHSLLPQDNFKRTRACQQRVDLETEKEDVRFSKYFLIFSGP